MRKKKISFFYRRHHIIWANWNSYPLFLFALHLSPNWRLSASITSINTISYNYIDQKFSFVRLPPRNKKEEKQKRKTTLVLFHLPINLFDYLVILAASFTSLNSFAFPTPYYADKVRSRVYLIDIKDERKNKRTKGRQNRWRRREKITSEVSIK